MRIAPLTLLLATLAAPALAQDYQFFQAPSGNIACAIFLGDGASARCDIGDYTPSYPDRPGDCDLDWGGAFVVGVTGPGQVGCVGDTCERPRSAGAGLWRDTDARPLHLLVRDHRHDLPERRGSRLYRRPRRTGGILTILSQGLAARRIGARSEQ